MGDLRRIAVVGDQRSQRVDQAKALVDACEQQDAAIRTDVSGIKGGGDFFLRRLGRENGRRVSSSSVGMADFVRASGVASAPNPYAIPDG